MCYNGHYLVASIPATEEEERKKNWRDFEDNESVHGLNDDKGAIVFEVSKRDDDNRSDYSDERIDKFGLVVVSFKFELMKSLLIISIVSMEGLPPKTYGGPSTYQLSVKVFTENGRIIKKWHSPMFAASNFPTSQTIECTNLSSTDIHISAVRIRLYGCERRRRDKVLSESIVGLDTLGLDRSDEGEQNNYRLQLEKRAELKSISKLEMDENNSVKKVPLTADEPINTQSSLMMGLTYNAISGRMTVDIVKGIGFRNPLSRGDEILPSTFVRVTLCTSNDQEVAQSNTTVSPRQANPVFKEKFIFQVPQFQLDEISIVVGVYHKKSTHRKELIGWFSVGHNCSSEEDLKHWTDMKDKKGEISSEWHKLRPSTESRHGLPGAE